METNHKYKNTADRQSTWFVIFFSLIALTISIGVAVIVEVTKNDYFVLAFFLSFIPLTVIFIILALYITSSKMKNKRGLKKLNQVLEKYSREYVLVKDVDKLDYVLITPYKIYGFTIRGYEGDISGMENEDTWRQAIFMQKKKNALANPIKENIALVEKLSKKINEEVEPITVLTSGNRGYINAMHLYTPNELDNLIDKSKVKYSDKDIDRIKKTL